MTTDEDNKRLKTELSEMKARHRLEIEQVTREKEQEMAEVHKRSVYPLSAKRLVHVVIRTLSKSRQYLDTLGSGGFVKLPSQGPVA